MATAGSTKINIDLALNTKGFRPLGRINGQLGEFEKSLQVFNYFYKKISIQFYANTII